MAVVLTSRLSAIAGNTMNNFEKWPDKRISLSLLKLDPQNPRLDFGTAQADTKEIIAALVELEDVHILARDIARAGYLPTEIIVAIPDGANRYIVVEGSRRLAALKLLENPDLAPVPKREVFRRYAREAEQNRTLPQKVRVTIAPNRTAARPTILNRHTGSNIKRWSIYAQARYIDQMRLEGFDVEEIAQHMGGSADDVKRRLRNAQLYESILSIPLDVEVADKVRNHRRFAFSTLQRLAESTVFRDWTGISISKQGRFTFASKKVELQKALARIVEDIVTKKVNTRTLNNDEAIQQYLNDLKNMKPARKQGRASKLETVVQPARPDESSGKSNGHTTGSDARRTAREHPVLPAHFKCNLKNRKIVAIFDELTRLSPVKFRNAWAITFRSLVDMVVQHYFDKTGHTKRLKAKLASQGEVRKFDWAPSLDRMLKYILEDAPEIVDSPQGIKNLRTLIQQKDHWFTMESMNQWVHNRYNPVTLEELQKVFGLVEPMLEIMLREPERPKAVVN